MRQPELHSISLRQQCFVKKFRTQSSLTHQPSPCKMPNYCRPSCLLHGGGSWRCPAIWENHSRSLGPKGQKYVATVALHWHRPGELDSRPTNTIPLGINPPTRCTNSTVALAELIQKTLYRMATTTIEWKPQGHYRIETQAPFYSSSVWSLEDSNHYHYRSCFTHYTQTPLYTDPALHRHRCTQTPLYIDPQELKTISRVWWLVDWKRV